MSLKIQSLIVLSFVINTPSLAEMTLTGGTVTGGVVDGSLSAQGTKFVDTKFINSEANQINLKNCELCNAHIVNAGGPNKTANPSGNDAPAKSSYGPDDALLAPVKPQASYTNQSAAAPQEHASTGDLQRPSLQREPRFTQALHRYDDLGNFEGAGFGGGGKGDAVNAANAQKFREEIRQNPYDGRKQIDVSKLVDAAPGPKTFAGIPITQSNMLDWEMGMLTIKNSNQVYDKLGNYVGIIQKESNYVGPGNGSGGTFIKFDRGYQINGVEVAPKGFVKNLQSGFLYDSTGRKWGEAVNDGTIFGNPKVAHVKDLVPLSSFTTDGVEVLDGVQTLGLSDEPLNQRTAH